MAHRPYRQPSKLVATLLVTGETTKVAVYSKKEAPKKALRLFRAALPYKRIATVLVADQP